MVTEAGLSVLEIKGVGWQLGYWEDEAAVRVKGREMKRLVSWPVGYLEDEPVARVGQQGMKGAGRDMVSWTAPDQEDEPAARGGQREDEGGCGVVRECERAEEWAC